MSCFRKNSNRRRFYFHVVKTPDLFRFFPQHEFSRTFLRSPDREQHTQIGATNRLIGGRFRSLLCRRDVLSDVQVNELTPKGSYVRLPHVAVYENQLPRIPEDPEYTHLYFVMHSAAEQTLRVVNQIANACHVSPGAISITQLNDANVVITQMASIEFPPNLRENARFLYEMNSTLGSITVNGFSWQKRAVRFGETCGNYYTILLRQFTYPSIGIVATLAAMKNTGFLNYYGVRKFGLFVFGHHHIGFAVMQRNYGAALIMMAQNEAVKRDDHSVRDLVDSAPWLKEFHTRFVSRNSDGYQKIYEALPKHVRLQHRCACQAFGWNLLVSARYRSQPLGKFGTQLGDVIATEQLRSEPDSIVNIPWETIPFEDDSSTIARRVREHSISPFRVLSTREVNEEETLVIPTTDVVMTIPTYFNRNAKHSEPHHHELLSHLNKLLKVSRSPRQLVFGKDLEEDPEQYEFRKIHVIPSHMWYVPIPHGTDIGTQVRLRTDLQLCSTQRQSLRNTFATQRHSLIEQRLPDGVRENVKSRVALHGAMSHTGARSVAVEFVLPSSSYVSSFLREGFRIERNVNKKEHKVRVEMDNVDPESLRTPGPEKDTRREFNTFRHPSTGNIFELQLSRK